MKRVIAVLRGISFHCNRGFHFDCLDRSCKCTCHSWAH